MTRRRQRTSAGRDILVPDHGAFVCSLDFELRWGLRERVPPDGGSYRANLHGVRSAVPKLLALFRDRDVHATWATVGMLMAKSRSQCLELAPQRRPGYRDQRLDPYRELEADAELEPTLHFAPTLVDEIAATPGQEIGTHTFSHYYCLEAGQDQEAFAADLDSAIRAAERQHNVRIRTVVFPRNQANPGYEEVLADAGLVAFRGNQAGWAHRALNDREARSRSRRAARLLDSYVPVSGRSHVEWRELPVSERLCNVRASAFLRPWSARLQRLEPVRLARLRHAIRDAARTRSLFHLWWHPHNFGTHVEENLAFLGRVLDEVDRCRHEFGMRPMSMREAAGELGF